MRDYAASVFRTLPAESSVFAWDGVSLFAEWRPYTNERTGKSGWISAGGLVRYGDPRKQEEDTAERRRTAEQAVGNALADPSKVTTDHLPKLHEHLKTIPRDKLKEMAKSLRLKVGGTKAAVADRLIAQVTGDTAPRQGSALESGKAPENRDDQPDRAHRGQDVPPKGPAAVMSEGHGRLLLTVTGKYATPLGETIKNLSDVPYNIPAPIVREFFKLAGDRGLYERGNMSGGTFVPAPDGTHFRFLRPTLHGKPVDPDTEKLLTDLKATFSRPPEPAPILPPVKIDHVGDPNHPVARAIADSDHARKVLGDLQPLIDKHRTKVDEYHAAEAELKWSRTERTRLTAQMEKMMADYADVSTALKPPHPRARTPEQKAANEKWKGRRDEFRRESDRHLAEVNAYEKRDAELTTKVLNARTNFAGLNDQFRAKLLESAKPETPVKLAGAFDPPAGGTWHERAEPLESGVTKQEFANAEGFVRGIVGHDRKIRMVYGKAKNRRGFCFFGSKEDGGATKPFTVVVSHDASDTPYGRHDAHSTAVHEIGHAIEATSPGLVDECKEFLDYRCGSEQKVKLNQQFVNSGYDDWESGRRDQFDRGLDPAAGESAPYYVGKEYGDATEVISMGLEHLYRNPAGLFTRDPEYAAFLMKVLRRSS